MQTGIYVGLGLVAAVIAYYALILTLDWLYCGEDEPVSRNVAFNAKKRVRR